MRRASVIHNIIQINNMKLKECSYEKFVTFIYCLSIKFHIISNFWEIASGNTIFQGYTMIDVFLKKKKKNMIDVRIYTKQFDIWNDNSYEWKIKGDLLRNPIPIVNFEFNTNILNSCQVVHEIRCSAIRRKQPLPYNLTNTRYLKMLTKKNW